MPFPGTHLKVVWGGPGYGADSWSCSLSVIPNFDTNGGVSTDIDQPTDLLPFVNAIQAFHTNASARISSIAKLAWVKVNKIDVNGRYVDTSKTYVHDLATPVGGGGGVGQDPWPQLAVAITLRTDRKRGIGSAGRFYQPYAAMAADSSGRISEADATGIGNNAATLINAINAIGEGMVGVASKGGLTGSPAFVPVRRVEVGRVIDTQRRRRAQLEEAYVAATTAVSV